VNQQADRKICINKYIYEKKSKLFLPVKTENVVLPNQFVERFFQFAGKQLPPGFGERGRVHLLL
jgi:hypothetical protein